jgi:MFS family permease
MRPLIQGVWQDRALREHRSNVNYGWIVVASVTMILTATSGARFLYGVVLKPVSEEFGWSRADLTGAVLVNMVILSMFQPGLGLLVDRIGPRRILIGGITIQSLCLIPLSMVTELWQIYAVYGVIMAVGFAATSPVNTTSLVSGWFRDRRGVALAIATSGSAFGQLLIVPLAALTLEHLDWPAVYRGLALLLAVIMVPVAVLLVREAPARPAGHDSRLSLQGQTRGADRPSAGLREALNTSAFWVLAFGFFACGFTMAIANTHFLAFADDMGMTSTEAADVVAVTAFFSILGSVSLGVAADRFRKHQVLALTYALRGAAFVLLLWLAGGNWLYFYAIVLGISWTATTPLTAAIAADLFGPLRIGVIFGSMFTFMNIGFGAGAFIDGLTYDVTGGYSAALVANAVLGFLAALAVLTAGKPKYSSAAAAPDGYQLPTPTAISRTPSGA